MTRQQRHKSLRFLSLLFILPAILVLVFLVFRLSSSKSNAYVQIKNSILSAKESGQSVLVLTSSDQLNHLTVIPSTSRGNDLILSYQQKNLSLLSDLTKAYLPDVIVYQPPASSSDNYRRFLRSYYYPTQEYGHTVFYRLRN
jgi:flagellar biogenesis protein FliO